MRGLGGHPDDARCAAHHGGQGMVRGRGAASTHCASLAHGHCIGDPENCRRWFRLPALLARAGYVVIVPFLAGISVGQHPSSPAHADMMLPPPATGVVGHGFGVLLGARFADLGQVGAFAGLSGVWLDWPSQPIPVEEVDGASRGFLRRAGGRASVQPIQRVARPARPQSFFSAPPAAFETAWVWGAKPCALSLTEKSNALVDL